MKSRKALVGKVANSIIFSEGAGERGGKEQVSYGGENEMIIILSPKRKKAPFLHRDLKESFLLSLSLAWKPNGERIGWKSGRA